MKRFLTLFCLVLSLLVIGGSLKLANQTTELASVVVDGEVIFNLRGGDQALARAKIANQLINETVRSKKTVNFRVIPVENKAILQFIATNENLLIVTPKEVVNEIDAVSQAKLWGDRLQISLEKAIALGQILVEKSIIHHVLDQYTFLDSPYLYRFYSDE